MENKFSWEEQYKFAQLSGDVNPMHTDPLVARRLIFGKPVVHGIHILLWALNRSLSDEESPVELVKIKAVFQGPLGLDEEVVCSVSTNGDKINIKLLNERTRIELMPQ
jgi:acyl dehydratase